MRWGEIVANKWCYRYQKDVARRQQCLAECEKNNLTVHVVEGQIQKDLSTNREFNATLEMKQLLYSLARAFSMYMILRAVKNKLSWAFRLDSIHSWYKDRVNQDFTPLHKKNWQHNANTPQGGISTLVAYLTN